MAAVLQLRSPGPAPTSLAKRAKDRLASMTTEWNSFKAHWMELQDYFLPRAGRWLTDSRSKSASKGLKYNDKLIDPTPKLCARTVGAGFHSGSTNPATQWFRLSTPDPEMMELPAVSLWLYTVENRMRDIFARSNLYSVLPTIYREAAVFGTAPMIMLEHAKKVIHFVPKTIGSYKLACNADGVVDTMYCEYKMSIRQIVDSYVRDPDDPTEMYWDRVSQSVRTAYEANRLEEQKDVLHVIEPNPDHNPDSPVATDMAWVSNYFELGASESQPPMKQSGFTENPLAAFRWETTEITDAYGSSPGMDALGCAKAMQLQQRRKAQAIDKLIDPPMVGDPGLQNQASTLVPGEVTYAGFTSSGAAPKFQPAYVIKPELVALLEDIHDTRGLVEACMYYNLFFAITQADPRNATVPEIDARREEQILALGPVLQNHEGGIIVPLIDRLFAIMVRASLPVWLGQQHSPINEAAYIPPPPRELGNVRLRVELIGALSQAFKAMGGNKIERFTGFVLNMAMAQVKAGQEATALDKLDVDQTNDEMAQAIGVPPTMVRNDDDVEDLRQKRAEAQQAAQDQAAAETADTAASAAQKLSETQTNNGSALDAVAGGM